MWGSWKRFNKVKFAAGGIDWREIGYTIGRRIAQYDYDVEVIATGMDMAMVNPGMVSRGDADFGINRNWVINWAIKGFEPFEEKMNNLRGIATIPSLNTYTKGTTPVLKAELGINSYKELVEKKLPLILKGQHYKMHHSGLEFGHVLNEYGSSWEELFSWGGKQIIGPDGYVPELNTAEQIIDAMKKGELDGGWLIPEIWKVAKEIKLKFLSIDDDKIAERLREKYGYLIIKVQPNVLYDGQESFNTWGYPGQFIFTREEAPDEFAYAVAKVINENSLEIAWCQPGLVGVPGRDLSNMWGVPMHRGAQEYYKSIGWM